MNRTRKIVVTIWVLLVLFVLAVLDWKFGGLKFVSRAADTILAFIASCLPMACVVLLYRLPRSRQGAWILSGLIPASCFCILGGAFFCLGQGLVTYIKQSSIRVGSSEVVTYFVDAGAWDDGDTFVQQEITLVPGLLWVKPLINQRITSAVKISVVDRHHIQCEYTAYKDAVPYPIPEAKQDVVWVF